MDDLTDRDQGDECACPEHATRRGCCALPNVMQILAPPQEHFICLRCGARWPGMPQPGEVAS